MPEGHSPEEPTAVRLPSFGRGVRVDRTVDRSPGATAPAAGRNLFPDRGSWAGHSPPGDAGRHEIRVRLDASRQEERRAAAAGVPGPAPSGGRKPGLPPFPSQRVSQQGTGSPGHGRSGEGTLPADAAEGPGHGKGSSPAAGRRSADPWLVLATYGGVVMAVFLFLAGLGGSLRPVVPAMEDPAAVPALAEPGSTAGGAGPAAPTQRPSPAEPQDDGEGAHPDLWQAIADRLWGWRVALRAAWPGRPKPEPGAPEPTDYRSLGRRVVENTLERLAGIRLGEPLSLVAAQMPVAHDMELFEEEGGPVVGRLAPPDILVGGLPNVRPPASSPETGDVAVAGGRPQVLIYHTHTSEAYVGAVPTSSGFDPAVEAFTSDPASSVVGVGAVVQNVLEEEGIGVIHLRQVFDREGERVTRIGNYQRALAVLAGRGGAGVLERYPTVDVVIDIHRDGVGRERTVATVRDQTVANLLFVVGTDRRLEHPQWHKNYCFVQWIVRRLNQSNPGLVKGVLLSDNRYNQHVRPGAILVEVGGYGNTPEEAERSAQMLGRALAGVIRDGLVPQADRPFRCPPGVQPPA